MPYQASYRWTYEDEDHHKTHWKVEISSVPKYDDLGYEMTYYAVEQSSADMSGFDYADTIYSVAGTAQGELTEIGTEYEVQNTYMDEVINVGTDEAPHYALKEDGTFTNTIQNTVTIEGQKIWRSLPGNWDDADLPQVEFTLYRSLADTGSTDSGSADAGNTDAGNTDAGDTGDGSGADAEGTPDAGGTEDKMEEVATLKITDREDLYSGTFYRFEMKYEGENTVSVDEDGAIVVSGEEGKPELPKYDGEGNLYAYTIRETNITYSADADVPKGSRAEDMWDVYKNPPGVNSYIVTNVYDSVKGAVAVKKFLTLPMGDDGKPEAYPAVTFRLTRTYTTNQGTTSSPQTVETKRWTSVEVKAAYEALQTSSGQSGQDGSGNGAAEISEVLLFENLDVYAPNGSKFVYSVEEVMDQLGGYDVWAAAAALFVRRRTGRRDGKQ